jgi:hypothetical protein
MELVELDNHRGEQGRGATGGVYLRPLSWSVHHNSSGWAEFTIMMECTPESGHHLSTCNLSSVCTLV